VTAKRLGVILPDAGADQSEWLRLEPWLAERNVRELRIFIELSPSDGQHEKDALYATGDLNHLVAAAKALADKQCDAIVWACTSGSFIGGRPLAERQSEALQDTVGILATNTSIALAVAVRALGADRVDVLSPYPAAITEVFVTFLRQMGIRTAGLLSLGCADGQSSSKLNLIEYVSEFHRRFPRNGGPLLVPDTAINSLDLLVKLEEERGGPVITANQASLWHGTQLAGLHRVLDRAGTLFRMPLPMWP
jgi:maleate isomerase